MTLTDEFINAVKRQGTSDPLRLGELCIAETHRHPDIAQDHDDQVHNALLVGMFTGKLSGCDPEEFIGEFALLLEQM